MRDVDEKTLELFVSGKDASLVLFRADWCPFCRKFKPVFESYEGKAKVRMAQAVINDEDGPLWDRFRVKVVPTLVMFKAGKEIARRDGIAGVGLSAKDMDLVLNSA